MRGRDTRPCWNDDLQPFTPLRCVPPTLMGAEGRAIIADPDLLAVVEYRELLERDMDNKAIECRRRAAYASGVIGLDRAKPTRW